jgi:hypothetical protein
MTTTSTPLFTNTAQPRPAGDSSYVGDYGYNRPSPLLFNFSTLLQRVISQAGSFHFTKAFHDRECGIYKCEGGCMVEGGGELVLSSTCCYWDNRYRGEEDESLKAMASLITKVVLEWDPMNPVTSMLETAAREAGCEVEDLRKAVFESRSGSPFGGNSLSDFFRWNPFSEAPIDEAYERWCWVNVYGEDEAEVVQIQADRALGKALLKRVNERITRANPGRYLNAMCCLPRRMNDGSLAFWINTGRSTQIDGWKTQEEIEAFIASDGVLVDKARY